MNKVLAVFCVLIFSEKIGSSGIPVSQTRTSRTNVVSHAYCDSSLSEEDKMDKKTLEEIQSVTEYIKQFYIQMMIYKKHITRHTGKM